MESPIDTFPEKAAVPLESMRSLSVGVAAPSAVVLNTKRPGRSFEPGVPSTAQRIEAPCVT